MHQLVPPMILDRLDAQDYAGSFPAACLFVDTAGFTPLTTALMAHGAEGVEVIAAILQEVFRPLVYAVYEQGGFIAGFAGDSFKAVFPGASAETCARCVLAADAIRRHMADRPVVETRFGSFAFAVKVCVADGAVDWEIWQGDRRDDGRQWAAYTFAGEALDRCMAMDPAVAGGEVALTAAVAARIAPDALRLENAAPYWRLRGIAPSLAAAHPGLPVMPPADDERATVFMPPAIRHAAVQGEFRQVVSMFINLRELPPPAERAALYRNLFEILARHGGYLCRVGRIGAGDAGATWLLFWGAPTSVEQDLQRALSFALDLQAAVDLPLRGGITNQLAYAGFVGADLREEYTCYGTAVNLAARLMASAGWGEIWLDQDCARAAGAEFICQPQGARPFKGFAGELAVFALKGRQQRWHPVAYGRPLVGRVAETASLDATLAALAAGANGGLTVVCGEAGIGKSRLLYEVQRHFAVQWFYCPSDGVVRQSLYPWRYFLRQYFAQSSAQTDDENRLLFDFGVEALIEATADPALGQELDRTRSLLAALVDIHWPGSLYERLDPKGRFENTLEALKTLLRAESLRQPLVLHLEDAHWLDADSLQFIPALLRSLAAYPVAVIATMRPAADHPLLARAAQVIELQPLDEPAIRQLAATLLGHTPPGHVSELVLARAEGNPFFAEQILLYMQEQGMLEVGADAALLPTNVWAILIARLDQLAEEIKLAVQTAAVLGREFEVGVLAQMLRDEALIAQSLESGQALAIWSAINQLRYIFRHALLRDAAYAMQLYARRRAMHQLAAQTLERLYAADLRPHYAALAYHYEQSGDGASTLVYLRKAADQARDGYQNAIAVGYYDRLIELLQALPDPASSLAEQVEALCQRGAIQHLTGDWTAAEATFAAALDGAKALPDPQHLARVQSLFGDFWQYKGDYAQALALSQAALELYEQRGDGRALAEALGRLGTVYWRLGEYDQALSVHQRALGLAEAAGDLPGIAKQHRNIALVYDGTGEHRLALESFQQAQAQERQLNNTLGVAVCMGNLGVIYNKLGEYDKALAHHQEALALVRAVGDKLRTATCLGNLGMTSWYLGNYDQTLAYYQQALRMDQELDNKAGVARHVGNLGTLYAELGDYDRAVEHFKQALAMNREFGFVPSVAGWLNNLGIMARDKGDLEAALEYFDEAIPLHRSIGKKDRLGESLIDKAELLILLGHTAEARELADEGLALAHETQTSRSIEQGEILRARLNFLDGDPAALADLEALLAASGGPKEQANLHYWLWRLGHSAEHASQARDRYAALVKRTPEVLFRRRLAEIEGAEVRSQKSEFRNEDSGFRT